MYIDVLQPERAKSSPCGAELALHFGKLLYIHCLYTSQDFFGMEALGGCIEEILGVNLS